MQVCLLDAAKLSPAGVEQAGKLLCVKPERHAFKYVGMIAQHGALSGKDERSASLG